MLEKLRIKFRVKRQTIRKPHWSFLPLWVVATAIGYSVGGKISAFITYQIQNNLGILLGFAVMSIAVALPQWLVIKRQISGRGWLWMTLIGGTVGGSLSSWASFQLAITYGDAVDLLVIYTCLRGFLMGLAQWMLLRQIFKLSDWWIVCTTASWYISVLIGSLLMSELGYFLTLFIGAIYGLLTGIILRTLFWHQMKYQK